MRKLFVALFAFIITVGGTYAQENLRIYKKYIDGNDAYGIEDLNGKAITPPKYGWIANEFSDGFILAYKSEKRTVDNSNNPFAASKTGTYWWHLYGFLDAQGKELTPFKYDYAQAFNGGAAVVSVGKKCGLINTQGKEITPIKYDEIKDFFSNTEQNLQVRSYMILESGDKKKYGLLSNSGKELTPAVYDQINSFYEGLAVVVRNNLMGVINLEGKEVAALRYSANDLSRYIGGVCRVNWNNKYGYIDKTGKEVVPLIYDRVFGFDIDGSCMVRQGETVGRIDKTGKILVPIKYTRVEPLSDGMYTVKQGNLYGWVDQAGKEVIRPSYEYGSLFAGGIAYVRMGKNFGAINKNNEIKIPLKYEYISRQDERKPLMYFKQGGKYGFFSETLTEISPAKYTAIYAPAESRSFVRIDNKWGMVNDNGQEITEIKYDTLIATTGVAFVLAVSNQKLGILYNNGRIKVPVKYDNLYGYVEGMCPVVLNNKFGFVDIDGKEVIAPQFDEVTNFENGKAQARLGTQTFFIDKTGKKVQ